jgi:hypothetical protein
VSRRGRTVAGTSARKNRTARRQAREVLDRERRLGKVDAPAEVVAPERLAETARRLREEGST